VSVNYIRTLNIDEPLARVVADGTVRYYQQDALGCVIALTDETGTIKTQYIYDPYGNTSVLGEPSDNPFQYTGRENDNTGLYYYRARYYSPELQRFISEDPILRPISSSCSGLSIASPNLTWMVPFLIRDPKNFNSYLYVGNNPVNYVDPYGYKKYGYKKCKPEYLFCLVACELACHVVTSECGPAGWVLCAITCEIVCERIYCTH